jgi:predicted 3-demethylubiquinone-9 3-methyltransferase (glyoxalase superfamily)
MGKIDTCLWFNGNGEEAAKFYTSVFKNSKIGRIALYPEAAREVTGQKPGSVMTVEFEIEGQKFLALNGGPDFKFTPAFSLFVSCKTEQEVDELWKKLKGGTVLFELQKYPWAEKYGWCEDKFGVSWQIMLYPEATQKLMPSFLFTGKLFGKGEEAINFYQSVFKNSKVIGIAKNPETNHVEHAMFELEGSQFALMEGNHDKKSHDFTMATSLIINCKTQNEVDYYWDNLVKGGGKHSQCGWLQDKFGVAWQVTPSIMGEIMAGPDPKKSENVFKEMLKMTKLDIEKLKAAYK